eukprot:6195986-Pleurochrysis_carterae.AAC.1
MRAGAYASANAHSCARARPCGRTCTQEVHVRIMYVHVHRRPRSIMYVFCVSCPQVHVHQRERAAERVHNRLELNRLNACSRQVCLGDGSLAHEAAFQLKSQSDTLVSKGSKLTPRKQQSVVHTL